MKLTTASENQLEKILQAHIVCLMCKVRTTSKDGVGAPIGFHCDSLESQKHLSSWGIKKSEMGKSNLEFHLHLFSFSSGCKEKLQRH